MASCHDCHVTSKSVKIRRSDYMLCDTCSNKRDAEAKSKESNKANSDEKAKPVSPIAKLFQHAVGHQHNDTFVSCTSTCSGNSNAPTATCSLCVTSYHLECIYLTKAPPKSKPWFCQNCRDMPSQIAKLQGTINMIVEENAKVKHANAANLNPPVANECKCASLNKEIKRIESQYATQLNEIHQQLWNQQHKLAELRNDLNTANSELTTRNEQLNEAQAEILQLKEKLTSSSTQLQVPSAHEHDLDNAASNQNKRAPELSLLIGDSMIRNIPDNELPKTTVKSISGLLIEELNDQLKTVDLSLYKNLIIHAGTNNVGRRDVTTKIVQDMEEVVTNVQIAAPNCAIFISGICPRPDRYIPDEKIIIDNINGALKELSTKLDCHFIDNDACFRYMNGEIDTSCFEGWVHLNEAGTEKLINNLSRAVFKDDRRKNPMAEVLQKIAKTGPPHKPPTYARQEPSAKQQVYGNTPRRSRQHNSTIWLPRQRSPVQPRTNCEFCGEWNHRRSDCRFRRPVTCFTCGQMGHKARAHNNNRGNMNSNRNNHWNSYSVNEQDSFPQYH